MLYGACLAGPGLTAAMCLSRSATFPCDVIAPRRAREFCGDCFRELFPLDDAVSEALDDYLLVVSELTSNAVNAGCGRVRLTVEVHRDHVRFAVDDDAPGMPRPGSAGPDDRQGRGLGIIESLARAWGVQARPGGKQVWVDLAIPTGLSLAIECRL